MRKIQLDFYQILCFNLVDYKTAFELHLRIRTHASLSSSFEWKERRVRDDSIRKIDLATVTTHLPFIINVYDMSELVNEHQRCTTYKPSHSR